MRPERQTGYTLIELLVTLAILAALLAMALPSFEQSMRGNRVATATNELLASFALARSEAIRSTRGAGVCSSDDGTSCGGSWNDGWLVWADADADGSLDDGETVLRYSRGNPALSATGPAGGAVVAFDARGRRRAAGGDQTVVLRPAECGGQPLQRTLTINASGQVRTINGSCS